MSINFPKGHEPQPDRQRIPLPVRRTLADLKSFLKQYFSCHFGRKRALPIDWHFFTPFECVVLKAVQKVKPGWLTTYGALARGCGHAQAGRAVGNVLRRNLIPILLPCHRVIRKDGSLGGYQSGRHWKKMLLSIENGVNVTSPFVRGRRAPRSRAIDFAPRSDCVSN